MKLTKVLSVLMTVLLLCGSLAMLPVSAESKVVFLPNYTANYTDGGYWANDTIACESYGDEGFKMTGYFRAIWAFTTPTIEKMPFLILEAESGVENLTRLTATYTFPQGESDIDISSLKDGAICINLLDFLAQQDASAYVYIAFYLNEAGATTNVETVFSKLYLSNVDLDGNAYVAPTQPPVPIYPAEYEIRKQLPIAAEQIVPGEGEDGTKMGQFLMSDHIIVNPINGGKGMELTLDEDSDATAGNIAWVFPYEWLEQTPYLVIEIENEGRADEGPRTTLFAYWEGVTAAEGGANAKLEGVDGLIGANKYHGVNRWTLKYSLDEIDQKYKDKHDGASIADVKGQGIAIQLWLGIDRADGTTLEPLVVKDAYLMGYKEIVDVETTTTAADNGAEGGEFPILPVAIAAAAVIVIAAVVVIVLKKKK